MLSGDFADDSGIRLKRPRFLVVDREVDQRGARLAVAALLPEVAEFAFNAADRHRDAGIEAHILLQVTPCRTASSAASAGPQEPAS